MIIRDVDLLTCSAVNHRVNHLANADTSALGSIAHIRGNNSSRDIQPRHTRTGLGITSDIRDINTAAGFLGIVASNLAIGNGDMGAVIGSKSSAAMVAVAFLTAEFGIAIVRNVTAGNSNAAAFGHDAATKSVNAIKRAITGDYATGHCDCRPIGIYTAAARSAVAGNYAVRNAKSRIFDRYSCAGSTVRTITSTNVTTFHFDGRAVLRVHQVSDTAVFLLCEHAALEIEITAVIDVDELQSI